MAPLPRKTPPARLRRCHSLANAALHPGMCADALCVQHVLFLSDPEGD